MRFRGTDTYVVTEDLMVAVNAAVTLDGLERGDPRAQPLGRPAFPPAPFRALGSSASAYVSMRRASTDRLFASGCSSPQSLERSLVRRSRAAAARSRFAMGMKMSVSMPTS